MHSTRGLSDASLAGGGRQEAREATGEEGERAEERAGRDLRVGREVARRVVRDHHRAEQRRHDAAEAELLRQQVRRPA